MCKVTSVAFVHCELFVASLHCELSNAVSNWLHRFEITLVAFVWPCSTVCFKMSPQIACMNPHWLHLIFLHYVFSNVSSAPHWRTIKSPFSLYKQIPKNPGISFSKIPLGPGGDGDDQWSRWLWQIFIRKIQRQKQVSSNFLIPCQELFSRWFILSSLFHP